MGLLFVAHRIDTSCILRILFFMIDCLFLDLEALLITVSILHGITLSTQPIIPVVRRGKPETIIILEKGLELYSGESVREKERYFRFGILLWHSGFYSWCFSLAS